MNVIFFFFYLGIVFGVKDRGDGRVPGDGDHLFIAQRDFLIAPRDFTSMARALPALGTSFCCFESEKGKKQEKRIKRVSVEVDAVEGEGQFFRTILIRLTKSLELVPEGGVFLEIGHLVGISRVGNNWLFAFSFGTCICF